MRFARPTRAPLEDHHPGARRAAAESSVDRRMAYDEALADRVRAALGARASVTERRMFGGLAFLLDGKMFVAVSGALILAAPAGPGSAYVVARTAAGGRREGLASCVGTGLGGLLHVVAAAFGLSLLLARSAVAFSVVQYVGAAYLVYLGVRILL